MIILLLLLLVLLVETRISKNQHMKSFFYFCHFSKFWNSIFFFVWNPDFGFPKIRYFQIWGGKTKPRESRQPNNNCSLCWMTGYQKNYQRFGSLNSTTTGNNRQFSIWKWINKFVHHLSSSSPRVLYIDHELAI